MNAERLGEALRYAAMMHDGQSRKGGDVPYVAHLLGVASLAMEHGASEDVAIAALLHDALEDQPGRVTASDLVSRFGDRVASLVIQAGEADKSLSWRERNEAYIQHLETADNDAVLVSLCDKVHNATAMAEDHADVGDALWSRFNAGRDEQCWKYQQLLATFKRRKANPRLVARLERQLSRLGLV